MSKHLSTERTVMTQLLECAAEIDHLERELAIGCDGTEGYDTDLWKEFRITTLMVERAELLNAR